MQATKSMTNFGPSIIFIYQTLVDRDPDRAGYDYWLSQIDSGANSLGDLANALARSSEYQNDLAHGVVRLYQAAFGRIPDQEGFEYWQDKLLTGEHTLQDVSTLFITSPEFATRFGNAPSVELLVSRMYQNTFGREPDSEGFAYWVSQVENGLTVSDLLLNFTESQEGVNLLDAHVQSVMMHLQLLGRMPTVAEQLEAPLALSDLVDALSESPEFSGPDPNILIPTITGAFEAGVLTLSGAATGPVLIDVPNQSITENGLSLTVEGIDWLTLAEIDGSAVTGSTVNLTGGDDLALTVNIGSNAGAIALGDLDDTVTLTADLDPNDAQIDLGFGVNTLTLNKPMQIDLVSQIQNVDTVTGSIGNDQVSMSASSLVNVAVDLGDGIDTISLLGGGVVDLTVLADITNVEWWVATGDENYDFVGTAADEKFFASDGTNRILAAGGADGIDLGEGTDVIAYGAVADSQFDQTGGTLFAGDVIYGFDFSNDHVDLPFLVDGEVDSIDISVGFASSLSETLAENDELTTAFSTDNDGDDIDAVLVNVVSGSAEGHYLIVQGQAAAGSFDSAVDLVVQMQSVSNVELFSLDLFV